MMKEVGRCMRKAKQYSPLSLRPRRRTSTGRPPRLSAASSWRICSSILSLTRRAWDRNRELSGGEEFQALDERYLLPVFVNVMASRAFYVSKVRLRMWGRGRGAEGGGDSISAVIMILLPFIHLSLLTSSLGPNVNVFCSFLFCFLSRSQQLLREHVE